MKKCLCSIVLGCLLSGFVYADDSDSNNASGLSFGVGLDYGFDSVKRTITPLPITPGQADITTSTFENKIGAIGSLQYLTQLGILFDAQLRLAYLIPDNGGFNFGDVGISSNGFNAELALLGGYRLGLGPVGIALKTGFAYSYSLRHYSANVAGLDVSASQHGNYISWKIAAEVDMSKFALGLSFGVPIFYGEIATTKIDNQTDVGNLVTNYDPFTKWSMFQMNIYAMYRF